MRLMKQFFLYILIPFYVFTTDLEIKTPPVFSSLASHHISAVSDLGDSLILEDGSVWEISLKHAQTILDWLDIDIIIITQNNSWTSKHNYNFINQRTKETVSTNLIESPLISSEYFHKIKAIDYFRGEIVLENNIRWKICSSDIFLVKDWLLDDGIIVGINTGWESSFPNILINVSVNKFVRSKQY
jgi:hypothetical protein